MKSSFVALVSMLLVAACASTPPSSPARASTPRDGGVAMPPVVAGIVALAPASASLVSGKLRLVPMAGGVHLSGEIGGLAPGSTHGLHVHQTGDCSAADASSAGPHFNPDARAHGNPQGGAHHAGDLPNITAGRDGVARVDLHVNGLTLGGAAATNIVGRALVVHAQADDYASQPAGNSGARIACGVIRAGR